MKDLESMTHICKDCETTFSYRRSAWVMSMARILVVVFGLFACAQNVIVGAIVIAIGLWSLYSEYGVRCPSCKSHKALPIDSPAALKLRSGKP